MNDIINKTKDNYSILKLNSYTEFIRNPKKNKIDNGGLIRKLTLVDFSNGIYKLQINGFHEIMPISIIDNQHTFDFCNNGKSEILKCISECVIVQMNHV